MTRLIVRELLETCSEFGHCLDRFHHMTSVFHHTSLYNSVTWQAIVWLPRPPEKKIQALTYIYQNYLTKSISMDDTAPAQ